MLDKKPYFSHSNRGQYLPTEGGAMPELGEIRHADDIGKKGGGYWKWRECAGCYKQEWKRTTISGRMSQPEALVCRPCNIAAQKKTFMVNIHSYSKKTV